MNKVNLNIELVARAWLNWRTYFNLHLSNKRNGELRVFLDFCDPVRQSAINEVIDDYGLLWKISHSIEIPEQVAKRVELLASPHFYATLKANPELVQQARKSWGKKPDV